MFRCKLDHFKLLSSVYYFMYKKTKAYICTLWLKSCVYIFTKPKVKATHNPPERSKGTPLTGGIWTALAPRSNHGVCTFNRQTEGKPKPMLSKFMVQKVKARSLWQTIQLSGVLLRLCLNEANSEDPTFNFKRWANWHINTRWVDGDAMEGLESASFCNHSGL